MTQIGAPPHNPVPIGEVSTPPFARLPDPAVMFAARAARFKSLAVNHDLGAYLAFLGDLAAVQHQVQDGLAPAELPAAEMLTRAREFGMPPLDRNAMPSADFAAILERLLALAHGIAKPAAAQASLARATAADAPTRAAMVKAVLTNSIPIESLAEHAYVAAALQVHFTRLAARLDAAALVSVGDGVCPACGGPPVISMVVGWPGAHGARFCACALCGTLWNYVRIKCIACGSTAGIAYEEIEGGPGTVKAETCDSCHVYVKVLDQQIDPALEPTADDVASLSLDLLVREAGFRRGGVNPFLLGY
ncbi:MAG: formate dehydrogenase accessory protein FdhE [Alphaproteobacteria bacterium]